MRRERQTFDNDREAAQALLDAVDEYGRTQGDDPAEDERAEMFNVAHDVRRHLQQSREERR